MKRINSYSVSSTDTGVNSLNSILTNALSFTSDDFLEIELKDAGTYNLARRFGLSCNLKIKGFVGADGQKSTLFFIPGAISATNMGDGFLSVRGVSGRIEATVENINVRLDTGIVPSASLLLNITVEWCNIVNENGDYLTLVR